MPSYASPESCIWSTLLLHTERHKACSRCHSAFLFQVLKEAVVWMFSGHTVQAHLFTVVRRGADAGRASGLGVTRTVSDCRFGYCTIRALNCRPRSTLSGTRLPPAMHIVPSSFPCRHHKPESVSGEQCLCTSRCIGLVTLKIGYYY